MKNYFAQKFSSHETNNISLSVKLSFTYYTLMKRAFMQNFRNQKYTKVKVGKFYFRQLCFKDNFERNFFLMGSIAKD